VGLLLAGGLARAQQPPALPPLPAPVATPPAWKAPALEPAPLPALPPAKHTKTFSIHHAAEPATWPSGILQTQQLQPPAGRPLLAPPSAQEEFQIQLLPPSFERLIRVQNEASLNEQIRQELREKTPAERAVFPEERRVTDEPFAQRQFPPMVALAEPYYVNYNRLYFHDLNAERYGWDLGALQPFVSAGLFYADLALLPYHWASRPCDCIDSSAGYCLPGDPVPFLIYPPNLSATGALGEAAVILGLVAIFP
jgi:hypothetical protein